jgi:hypothetical protein
MCVDVSGDVCGDERGGEWSGGEGDGQRPTIPSDHVSFLNRGFNFNFWIYRLFTSVTVTYRHNH